MLYKKGIARINNERREDNSKKGWYLKMSNYIFELSNKVTRKSVLYNNRFGIQIAADLYLPKNFDESKKHAAVIIGAPYGDVKEQGPGIYAQNLAERGFVEDTVLKSEDGADAVVYAISTPETVSISEILIRPTKQAL